MYHNHTYKFYGIVVCTAILNSSMSPRQLVSFMTSFEKYWSGKSPWSFALVFPLWSFARLLRQRTWRTNEGSKRTNHLFGTSSFVSLVERQRVLYLSPSFVASFVPCTLPVCLYRRVANVLCSMRKEDRLSWPDMSLVHYGDHSERNDNECYLIVEFRMYIRIVSKSYRRTTPSYLLVLYTRFSTTKRWYYACTTRYWYLSATACMLLCTNIAPWLKSTGFLSTQEVLLVSEARLLFFSPLPFLSIYKLLSKRNKGLVAFWRRVFTGRVARGLHFAEPTVLPVDPSWSYCSV